VVCNAEFLRRYEEAAGELKSKVLLAKGEGDEAQLFHEFEIGVGQVPVFRFFRYELALNQRIK